MLYHHQVKKAKTFVLSANGSFHVTLTTGDTPAYSVNHVIIFRRVKTNTGNAYDSDSVKYVAPYDGKTVYY